MTAVDRSHRAVTFVTPDPAGRGGMATVVRGLLASSLADRYELHAIATHRVGPRWTLAVNWLRGLGELAVWCLRHPGGIVHVHSAVRGSLYRKAGAILLARALRHPVVLQLHAGPGDIGTFSERLGSRRRAFIGAALRRAQVVLSVSEAGAQALRRAFGPLAVDVIPNAAPGAPASVTPPSGRTLLFLGGFANPVKGGEILARALPRMLEGDPGLRVVLAGPGDLPAALEPLLGERVEWRGWVDQEAKARAIAEAAVVVIPSTSEGLPIVLLEAMSHGRGIVATRVGGIPDTISDGADGLLVAPGDEDALVAAVLGLVGDPPRLQALGAAARRSAEAFGEGAVVERLDAIYRDLATR